MGGGIRREEWTYRPMDQVKIDVLNTEVLQSGFKTLPNTLMVGTRELARNLQKPRAGATRPRGPSANLNSPRRAFRSLTKISDRWTPDRRIPSPTNSSLWYNLERRNRGYIPTRFHRTWSKAVPTKRNRDVYTRFSTRARWDERFRSI